MIIGTILVALLIACAMGITPAMADEGGGGGDPTLTTTDPNQSAPATGDPTPSDDASDGGPAPEGDKGKPNDIKTDPVAELLKLEKENARIKGALSGLQTANKDLLTYKAEQEAAQKAKSQPTALADHPALKGLVRDEESGLVEYHGAMVTPEFVIAQYDTSQKLANIERFQNEFAESQRAARVAEAHDGLIKAVTEITPGIREKLIPGLTGEVAQTADNLLLQLVSANISSGLRAGQDISPEGIMQAFERSGSMIRDISSQASTNQYRDNNTFKAQYPALNGKGQTGNPSDVDYSKMSRSQREALGRQAAVLAEAARGR